MKVILLRDVAKIGRRFEIKEVPDGYALNKLIPQKDAEPATPANVKRVAEKAKLANLSKEGEVALAKEIVAKCQETPLLIMMEANGQGHLFQSVHAKDIVSSAKKVGLTIPEQFIKLTGPIKSLGQTEVPIVTGDFKSAITIEVVSSK